MRSQAERLWGQVAEVGQWSVDKAMKLRSEVPSCISTGKEENTVKPDESCPSYFLLVLHWLTLDPDLYKNYFTSSDPHHDISKQPR